MTARIRRRAGRRSRTRALWRIATWNNPTAVWRRRATLVSMQPVTNGSFRSIADDRLEPEYAAACGAAIEAHPDAAFAYTDYRVFGRENYVERLADYNLYGMLDRNTLTYAALIRKKRLGGCRRLR